mgnify:CR=1 FL=1
MTRNLNNIDFSSEWEINTARSSGKGGQHVNKVSTKVELRFDIPGSELLSEEEKNRLQASFKNRLTKKGTLIITSENESSQALNKKDAIDKFYKLINEGIKRPKKRIPTKTPKKAKEKRLEKKKQHSEKKATRAKNKQKFR